MESRTGYDGNGTTSVLTLLISDLTIGIYTCVANRTSETLNATAEVSAYGIVVHPSPLSVSSSDPVSMMCAADAPIHGEIISIVWSKDEGRIERTLSVMTTSNTTLVTSLLVFPYPLSSMAGEYKCTIWYNEDSLVSEGAMLVMTGIMSFPRGVRVLSGADAEVQCVGVGAEYSTGVVWTVDGLEIPRAGTSDIRPSMAYSNGKMKWSTGTLTFSTIREGVSVRCEMYWGRVTSLSPYLCTVTVLGLKQVPVSRTVIEGTLAVLYCTANGPPMPSITWKKDNVTIEDGYIKVNQVSRRILSSALSMGSEAGGSYTCQASYTARGDFAGGEVMSQPAIVTVAGLKGMFGPSKVLTNATVTFQCRASSDPTPKFQWTHNGIVIERAWGTQITKDTVESEYTISNIERTQGGTYGCSAVFTRDGEFLGRSSMLDSVLTVVDDCTTTLLPNPKGGSLTCAGTSYNYQCNVLCSEGWTLPDKTEYKCKDGQWEHISASNPEGKTQNCYMTQLPASRTMTVVVRYPSSLGASTCYYTIGGYVVQSYPYYLAEAALTSVSSGDCFLEQTVTCGGDYYYMSVTFKYTQTGTMEDDTMLKELFYEMRDYILSTPIDPYRLLRENVWRRRRRSAEQNPDIINLHIPQVDIEDIFENY